MPWLGVTSYGAALLAYGAVTAVFLVSHPVSRRARWLTLAAAVSTLWAAGILLILLNEPPRFALLASLDALHAFVWVACVLSWLSFPARPAFDWRRPALTVAALITAGTLLACVVLRGSPGAWVVHFGIIALATMGLLGGLRLAWPARETLPQLRLLSGAFAVVLAADLLVYGQGSLDRELIPALWQGRGIANAVVSPFLLLAMKGQPEWEHEPFVSRHVAFYLASLIGVGIYLLAVGGAIYSIGSLQGQWVFYLELVFLLAAFASLMAFLLSRTTQARLKVFLAKHFYRNKYDYRQEWLRLTEILGRARQSSEIAAAGLRGIALILGSKSGDLWLARDDRRYDWMGSLEARPSPKPAYEHDHALVKFLASKGWVIDSQEYARDPDHYDRAFGLPEQELLPRDTVTVPLDCQGALQGFVILQKPPVVGALNFEDHDILRTAGRQLAVLLAQSLAQEKLAETRQFETMSKLSTFLVHDLKNLIAQQELVLSNAQRFRHRPEFLDDTASTIRSGVGRMRRLLDQLQGVTMKETNGQRTEVAKVLAEVALHCSDREPTPEVDHLDSPCWIAMERDKLASVLTHLIRNAQDATPPDGKIRISVKTSKEELSIAVADTGSGMDAVFMRDRLFRPFDTTKGAKGMGIGAYQVRETIRAAGGNVEVRSAPGSGTTFTIVMPRAAVASRTQPLGKPAA